MDATIGSLAPWFGAKRRMSAEIIAEIGPHHSYWEPFAGSMAILLAKPRSRTEVVNDLHGDLVNLARVIQHPDLGPAIYRRLRRVLASQELFADAMAALRGGESPAEGPDLDRAFHYFIASWQGMNGVAGTVKRNANFCRRFTSLGGDPATRWVGAVRSIPQWRRRLEGVQVLRADGIELCEKVEDREGTVIYADPPYLVKGARYLHDFTDEDHGRLAAALRRFRRTRVVVSYYDHPRLTELYPGWRARPVAVARGLDNPGRRDSGGVSRAPEILLVNGPEVSVT